MYPTSTYRRMRRQQFELGIRPGTLTYERQVFGFNRDDPDSHEDGSAFRDDHLPLPREVQSELKPTEDNS